MCGLAGYMGRFAPGLLEAMGAAIAHRGPDDSGSTVFAEDGVGLAHRRLSIIDLSPRGHQPMLDATRRAAIVYNGELYNYRNLRQELVSDGMTFQSDSDTEVVLNLYLRDGPEILRRLNGIFAFAIWDLERRHLFLARDGLGVKPLYYAETSKGLLFASELKALLHEDSVPRSVDPRAVHNHLSYLWCPSPRTMLDAVKKLEPGCAMLAREGRIRTTWAYYQLPTQQPTLELTEEDAVSQVRSGLATAVERQLVSDVPVGSFLSGGLDSSSVVAMARRAQPDATLDCFTIGFRDDVAKREGMAHDRPYAERVAGHLGVRLHTIYVGPEMIDELERMIFHLDEPQADPAPINTLFIAKLAREHGIKVLLSGTGGDDIFTGYRRHYAVCLEGLWSWLPRPARASLARLAGRIGPGGEMRRRLAKAFRYADLEGDERIASYFRWIHPSDAWPVLNPELRKQLEKEDAPDPLVAELAGLAPEVEPLSRMLHSDAKYFLADHNLNYGDKIPMAYGVEVRVPFLDPDLVELATRLPNRYKQHGWTGKWILRKAMEGILPRDVIYRSKTGFGAPLRHWMRNELRGVVEDVLSEESLRRRGLFDPAGVRRLVDLNRAGRIDAAYPIFSIMCMEFWCRMFLDGPVPAPTAKQDRCELRPREASLEPWA